MREQQDERSLGELFGDLARETSTLVRQEVELAKVEMTQKATRVGKDIGFLAMRGLNALKRETIVPERTMQTLKEDAAWAKEQVG